MTLARAFQNWTVVEVADGFASASLAGKLLADLGCEVVKIESRDGDSLRRGPAGSFELLNATKRSVGIDWTSPAAGEPLHTLLDSADVLLVDAAGAATVERALHGTALASAAFARAYPRLTLCRATAFGATGPLADWRGGEEIVQAAAGTMSISGFPGQPTRIAAAIHTHANALFAVTSILADRLRNRPTERMRRLDTSLYDAAMAFMTASLPSYYLAGRAPEPIGNRHSMAAPWNTFRCADGWVIICTGNHSTWLRLAQAIGMPELIDDPRYATQEARVRNVEALEALVERWTLARRASAVEAQLDREGIPCGPALPLGDVLRHPQFTERALMVESDGVRTVGGVFHWNGAPLAIRIREHRLGGATQAVLCDAKRAAAGRVPRWRSDGAVFGETRAEGADVGLAA